LTTNIYDRKIARETSKVISPFSKLDRTMHDLLIRGATVVDGTGAKLLTADVAVNDGLITEVGRITSNADRTIAADGAHFLPGFVDIHTHYDGQVSWDETFTPSIYHGVTTLVMGNCGLGFAPFMKADLNLVQLDRLALPLPRIVRDLPSGGRRLMQKASGYLATFVSGRR
jgi:N-acyl-D-aspartate/D-glutamate deacylase